MTRFARAKGSKSSNERIPESATPWKEMKKELIASHDEVKNKKHREEMNKQRQESYDNFIGETEKKEIKKWAEFPGSKLTKRVVMKAKKRKPVKTNSLVTEADVTDDMIDEFVKDDSELDPNFEEYKNKIENVLIKIDKGKKNKQKPKVEEGDDDAPEECNAKVPPPETKTPKKKNKNKKRPLKIESVVTSQQKNGEENFDNKKQQNGNKNKKQQQPINNKNSAEKRKLPKKRDDKEHKRRKPDVADKMTMMVHGELEEITRFDGFPLLKSDAERLKDLKQKLIGKSVPKSEVQRTMKLERRKAEKSLSRLKKQTCFQCRKTGHVLSSCPELASSGGASDICFKCGSTEHTSSSCKSKSDNYKFAKCFICREQGHLARECPDNPRGLYPDGGCCKLCGDVTHLKKDCPQHQQKEHDNSLFLDTISGSQDLEGLGGEKTEIVVNKKKTVVKF